MTEAEEEEKVSASATVNASAQTVFDVLADPSTHPAIDGTGWVREARGDEHLTDTGQIFRMAMYVDGHPDGTGHYETANKVEVFDPPRAIAWKTGHAPGRATSAGAADDELEYGGWFWRYDLTPVGDDRTEVTLTYDWSNVPPSGREIVTFPPFENTHLDNSLKHLAALAESR
jgi:hypothetical protein